MRIIHPHPVQGRQKFIGVEFIDGFAVVESLHPETEAALVQHRFSIEHEAVAMTLESATLAELRDLATAEGIDYPARVSKKKLIGLIESAPIKQVLTDDGSPFEPLPEAIEGDAPRVSKPRQIAVPDIVRLNEEGRALLGNTNMTAEVQEISPDLITVLWEDGKASDITPSLIELVED